METNESGIKSKGIFQRLEKLPVEEDFLKPENEEFLLSY